MKNVHPVYGAGIQTHDLRNMSLLPGRQADRSNKQSIYLDVYGFKVSSEICKFVKFQMSLTDLFSNQSLFVYFSNNNNNTNPSTTGPNLQVNNHSNKSTVSSLLAASELSKQQNSSNNNNNNNTNSDNNNNMIQFSKRGSIKEIVKNDCIKLVKINNNNSNNKTNQLYRLYHEKKQL